MARKSFFGRLVSRIREIFSGPAEPVTEPIPKIIDTPPPVTGDELELDFNRRQIWEDVTGVPSEFGDIDTYWEIYVDSGAPIGEPYGRINHLWRNFLRAFYLTLEEAEGYSRDDWYQDADVPSSLIDWYRWREVKRGTP